MGVILMLDANQESLLAASLLSFNGKYSAFGPNCTTPVQTGLSILGLSIESTFIPEILMAELAASGLAVGENFYPQLASPAMSQGPQAIAYELVGEPLWSRFAWGALMQYGGF
jgi:hypothetical protein